MNGEEAIMAVAVFGGGLWLLGPIARAAAERLRSRPETGIDAGRQDELAARIDGLQQEMLELQERLDFAERMLAKQRDVERIGPGG